MSNHATETIEDGGDVAVSPATTAKPKALRSPEIQSCPSSAAGDLAHQTLHFLSTASNETLGGIAVGLAACTYIVLGRLGLILLGGLGGVVLHATWEGQRSVTEGAEDTRRETGLEVVKRLLDLRSEVGQTHQDDRDEQSVEDGKDIKNFSHLRPETAAALTSLVEAINQDYVKWWYHPLLPGEPHFPASTKRTLVRFIASLSQHVAKKRPADTFLDFLTNSSSIVIVFLSELSNALTMAGPGDLTPTESVYAYLSNHPDSNLKTILDQRSQTKKLRMVADDILQNFMDKSALDCDPARVFLREILAGVVLEMTLKTCSKPAWINAWIVYLLESGEPDISQAIDAGMARPSISADAEEAAEGKKTTREVSDEVKGHRRRISKAEEAMEEAMEEAKRLSQLIAEEDAKKLQLSPGAELETVANNITSENKASQPEATLDTAHKPLQDDTEPPALPPRQPHTPIKAQPFTSFDQIIPPASAFAQAPVPTPKKHAPLTLHNANVTIHDDSGPNDKGRIRNKPTAEYLIQIEPESSHYAGWMIMRKYADFETLHEILRRIAQVSGVTAFTEQHATLPGWREHTKSSLRGELERYLRDACWFQPLAESEGMKRFLEKDHGQINQVNQKASTGIAWQAAPAALETMGKGMLDVLSTANKGATEGGKAVLGGVTGVLGSLAGGGQKKVNGAAGSSGVQSGHRISSSTLPKVESFTASHGVRRGRASEDTPRGYSSSPAGKALPIPMESQSSNMLGDTASERESRASTSGRSSISGRHSTTPSRESSRAPSTRGTAFSSPTTQGSDELNLRLPPPPSAMPDDVLAYEKHTEPMSTSLPTPTQATTITAEPAKKPMLSAPRPPAAPLSEAETRMAVELLFAVVNELYTLSSAWNIRRTLLNAAKTFLLRPGNPSLSSIRTLIQESLIASHTSDAGIAGHLDKLRSTCMPTEEELRRLPTPPSAHEEAEEAERLRVRARRLLIERGLPTALTGVMGQAATAESMGKVFDCLQMEEMARGLVFGLLLQGVRALTH